jgi:rhamnosyltransferase
MSDLVCGVIVTYHPDEELAQHIAVLRGQVGGLVVVDNRSSDSERVRLRELALQYSFTLLENSDNLGIGAALNQGVRWAAAHGVFRYVALFDQDSEASGSFVDAMVSFYHRHLLSEKVAVVAPRIQNRNTGASDGPRGTKKNQHLVAQTSGCLMPLHIFESQGWFKEELFIDYVDYEYCLRVVAAGWVIAYCEDAILSHVPGNSRRHTLFGIYLTTTLNYSPMRQYYSMRNGVWVMLHYWHRFPDWCVRLAFRVLKGRVRVAIFEQQRKAKLFLTVRAIQDAFKDNLGKRAFSNGVKILAK